VRIALGRLGGKLLVVWYLLRGGGGGDSGADLVRGDLVASELGDPGGIVLDAKGALYVPEAAVHRIIRIAPDP